MKNYLTIVILLISIFAGCSEQLNVNQPENVKDYSNLKLITLPSPSGMSIETLHTEELLIDGQTGGIFIANFTYQSSVGTVFMQSTLVLPPNSFSGTINFTQTFNTETASISFSPSIVFNEPVNYSLTISGINLNSVNPNTLDFVVIDVNNYVSQVEYDSLSMDTTTGTLEVLNAQRSQLSRYAFVN